MKIVIGTEDNQYIAQQTLIFSIKQTLSIDVEILPTVQQAERVGGTNFGFVRFMVPQMCGYRGRAIYMDADQLVFEDMKNLFDALDGTHDVACVHDPKGSFGGKVVEPCNQTSVMVLQCDRLQDWNPATMFTNVKPNRAELAPGEMHYREFMKLAFMDPARVMPLDPRWNHFNIYEPGESKLTHFSHVRSQPWKNPAHPLTEMWTEWMLRALAAGYFSRERLWKEIQKGHVDESFQKHAIGQRAVV